MIEWYAVPAPGSRIVIKSWLIWHKESEVANYCEQIVEIFLRGEIIRIKTSDNCTKVIACCLMLDSKNNTLAPTKLEFSKVI